MLKLNDECDLKVCDFKKNGNVIRLYLTELNDDDYSASDWDDRPYEHNADTLSDWYSYVEFAFPLKIWIAEPADDWHYNGNSPYSKDDFKAGKIPCLLIGDLKEDWHDSYSEQLGNKQLIHVYYNTKISVLREQFIPLGGVLISIHYVEGSNGKG